MEDRPDVVILRKSQGVFIIEVKDYDLDKYQLDSQKNWKLKSNNAKIKSPLSQALKYKKNLFELHIDNLLELKIKDIRNFNIVSSAVYFHNANSEQINDLLVTPYEQDRSYQNFLKYRIDLIGRDTLNELDFKKVLRSRFMISNQPSSRFSDELHSSIRRFLKPSEHLKGAWKGNSLYKEAIRDNSQRQGGTENKGCCWLWKNNCTCCPCSSVLEKARW